jgi:hypothetical protein
MATALAASALLLGACAERLRRAGIPTELFLAAMLALSMAAQLGLLLGLPVSSHLLFAVVAAAGAATVLSFAVLAQYFPKEVSGRANAALGVLNMGTAFGLQCLSGLIVGLWVADGGRYPAEAHQAAMAAGLGLQLIALGVFFTPGRRLKPAPMAHAVARAIGFGQAPLPIARPVYASWTYQAELARRQRAAWAFAATASAALCVVLAATVLITISRPAVALHVIHLSGPSRRDFELKYRVGALQSVLKQRPVGRIQRVILRRDTCRWTNDPRQGSAICRHPEVTLCEVPIVAISPRPSRA